MRDIITEWVEGEETAARIAHVETVPARGPIYEDPEPPIAAPVAAALASRGIERLYRHQAQTIRRARVGTHTVVVAGTAAGKSLGYQVPIAEAVLEDRRSTALLLFPTKALTQDQYRSLYHLGIDPLV
ncbi:MAG: DEAD/DEAH box helicase, partial [Gemmatimonadetes bacterium]|nr:DEAD/DEAH box helicase [Gemmatimonadota bacterium]NIR42218.1 DEAD/DEAH box helicase [Actinomycetota bacterium]NIU80445.1 DEAD/DEAH box helicase [Gammaproteobacteria bacterium]NIQ60230.1 DEAD/DEAH box helicase [Gemmatimonadota bacterium]NIV91094.1 DEAD/DEAH box helicase [Actinomycetota bacterium]